MEIKKYFWDYDFGIIDCDKNDNVIMHRIMERGDFESMCWLMKKYSSKQLSNFIRSKGYKLLPLRELNYWAIMSNMKNHERKELMKKAKKRTGIWYERMSS